jgi:hypothetical protein
MRHSVAIALQLKVHEENYPERARVSASAKTNDSNR